MNFFSTVEFFSAPGLFGAPPASVPDGLHSPRTFRLPMSARTMSASAAALVLALAGAIVTTQVPVTLPLVDTAPIDSDEPRSTERIDRHLRFQGRDVPASLEIEHWPDGTTVARLAGTSLYGEAPSLSRAIGDLQENLEEFAASMHDEMSATARTLGGQVLRDWTVLDRMAGGVRRV